jgi:hypothetical protein
MTAATAVVSSTLDAADLADFPKQRRLVCRIVCCGSFEVSKTDSLDCTFDLDEDDNPVRYLVVSLRNESISDFIAGTHLPKWMLNSKRSIQKNICSATLHLYLRTAAQERYSNSRPAFKV